MVFRVLQFVIGLALAGGGGFLVWTHRAEAAQVFPPGASGLPVLLIAGLLGVTSGIVLVVSALHPRPNQRRLAAEKAAREDAALGEAEAYYSARARAADRDWRSGDIPPPPPPAPPPEPQPVVAPIEPMPPPQPPRGQRSLSMPPAAGPAAAKPAPPPPPPKPAPKPVASAATAPAPHTPFPAIATLHPIPRASEPPPAPAQAVASEPAPPVASDDPHADIRAAIQAGKLEDADRMLSAARDNATGMELALLTALAGDHAAVSGRQSHAKWLWRLALKRFGELDAANSTAAKAVAESLRQAG